MRDSNFNPFLVSSTTCANMTCNNNGTCVSNSINQGVSCSVTTTNLCTNTSSGTCSNGVCSALSFTDGTSCNSTAFPNPSVCTTYQCANGTCGLNNNTGRTCGSPGKPSASYDKSSISCFLNFDWLLRSLLQYDMQRRDMPSFRDQSELDLHSRTIAQPMP